MNSALWSFGSMHVPRTVAAHDCVSFADFFPALGLNWTTNTITVATMRMP